MKNKCVIRARISERTFRSVLRLFCLDIEAAKAAVMTGLSRNSIEKIFVAVRQRLSLLCAPERKLSTGVYELDESYFGAHWISGVRRNTFRLIMPTTNSQEMVLSTPMG